MIQRIYNHFMHDPLYRNSIYVMASTFVMAVLGFLFWIFVARLFPSNTVGIATTLISVMTLISGFGHLGLNVGLIRYLPQSTKRNDIISSSFLLIILSSVIITSIFLFGLSLFSPKLLFLQSNWLFIISFIVFMIGATCNIVMDSIFMAYRAAGNILIKNTLLSVLKLLLPIVFISLGAYGIFASVALATLVSVFLSSLLLIFRYHYKPTFTFNIAVLKDMAAFSGGNYIAGFLFQAPALILPILIVNYLGAVNAAYFYLDFMILNFLIIIPMATTQSLLTEGSYDSTQVRIHVKKTAKIIALLLIPSVILAMVFGNYVLHFFGKEYATGAFQFLQIISFSAFFMAITFLGNALLNIKHKVHYLIWINLLNATIILTLSYFLISYHLVGIGVAWLTGQVIVAAIYLVLIKKFI